MYIVLVCLEIARISSSILQGYYHCRYVNPVIWHSKPEAFFAIKDDIDTIIIM